MQRTERSHSTATNIFSNSQLEGDLTLIGEALAFVKKLSLHTNKKALTLSNQRLQK